MHPGVLASVSPHIQFNWASYAANNPIEDYCFGVHDPNKRALCCCDVWSMPAGFADSVVRCVHLGWVVQVYGLAACSMVTAGGQPPGSWSSQRVLRSPHLCVSLRVAAAAVSLPTTSHRCSSTKSKPRRLGSRCVLCHATCRAVFFAQRRLLHVRFATPYAKHSLSLMRCYTSISFGLLWAELKGVNAFRSPAAVLTSQLSKVPQCPLSCCYLSLLTRVVSLLFSDNTLYVANCGDSRAVLATSSAPVATRASTNLGAVPMSFDQTASNVVEIAALRARCSDANPLRANAKVPRVVP